MKDAERVILETRTTQQNKAIHVFFELLAEELNNAGLDMKRTLKESVDIPWTATSVKEYLWKPVQESMVGKKSTTELSTTDVNKIYEVLNRHLGEKHGLSVIFPCVKGEK